MSLIVLFTCSSIIIRFIVLFYVSFYNSSPRLSQHFVNISNELSAKLRSQPEWLLLTIGYSLVISSRDQIDSILFKSLTDLFLQSECWKGQHRKFVLYRSQTHSCGYVFPSMAAPFPLASSATAP